MNTRFTVLNVLGALVFVICSHTCLHVYSIIWMKFLGRYNDLEKYLQIDVSLKIIFADLDFTSVH